MHITSVNIHGITQVRIERERSGNTLWTNLHITGPDGAVTITVFADEGYVDIIDADAEPDEPVIIPLSPYEPIGYADDLRNAGRGHLLGDR